VEFWSPQLQCSLPDLPKSLSFHTVDYVDGSALTCYGSSCLRLSPGTNTWEGAVNTIESRELHTSAVTSQGLLLIGGLGSISTTELVTVDGSAKESFTLEQGRMGHCSIQLSDSKIVLTGGQLHPNLVTEYSGIDNGWQVTAKQLEPLITPRYYHACATYNLGHTQFLAVVGGESVQQELDSTEVMDYTNGGSWRTAGALPSTRYGLKAASIDGQLYVMGGNEKNTGAMDEILIWEAIPESWTALDQKLTVPRAYHAVAEVDLNTISNGSC